MNAIVRLYSLKQGEISSFLEQFYKNKSSNDNKKQLYKDKSSDDDKKQLYKDKLSDNHKKQFNNEDLLWQKEYCNPIEIADIIGALIENQEDYNINMWISLDKDLFINITESNADEVIRYLYERYPY